MVENKEYTVFNLIKNKIIGYIANKLHVGHSTILNVRNPQGKCLKRI